jgi:hypothetical protein
MTLHHLLLPSCPVLQASSVVAAHAVPALVQLLASQRRSCQVGCQAMHMQRAAAAAVSSQPSTFLRAEEAFVICFLLIMRLLRLGFSQCAAVAGNS